MNLRSLLFALPLACAAWAQPAPPPGDAPIQDVMRFRDKLELSADQMAQIQGIRQSHEAALQTLGKSAQSAQEALKTAMEDATTATDALAGLHLQAANAAFAVTLEQRAAWIESLAVLSADQLAKLKAIQAEIKAHQEALRALLAPPTSGAPDRPAGPPARFR